MNQSQNYRDYQARIAPPWLQQKYGTAWLNALGDTKDELVERIKAAVKARMPLLADRDALEAIGLERQIERLPGETNASYSARIQKAWDSWKWRGTAKGVLLALDDIGLKNAFIEIVRGAEYSLDANRELITTPLPPGSWAIDVASWFWSKFQVLFTKNPFSSLPPSESEIEIIRGIIRSRKAALSTCAGVIIYLDGELWGYPKGSWGDPGVWGGNSYFFEG